MFLINSYREQPSSDPITDKIKQNKTKDNNTHIINPEKIQLESTA
jgi:hypothetical protein